MIEQRICPRCGKEYVTEVTYVRVPKCASCDDTEYVIEKQYMEYCSPECMQGVIEKMRDIIKDKLGGKKWKRKNMK